MMSPSAYCLIVAVIAVVVIFVWIARIKVPENDTRLLKATVFANGTSTDVLETETFPYAEEEWLELAFANEERHEDELAALALFTAYEHLDKMTPETQICVGGFLILPVLFSLDYEGTAVIGVRRIEDPVRTAAVRLL